MVVKNKWTNEDFEEMNWHDVQLYSVRFYENNYNLTFDNDYLFKWELNEKTKKYRFWISPCKLTFLDVSDLRIDLDFQNVVGVSVENITRSNGRKSPNGKMKTWDYTIETNVGRISFSATDYVQDVLAQPVLSKSQILGRPNGNSETSLN